MLQTLADSLNQIETAHNFVSKTWNCEAFHSHSHRVSCSDVQFYYFFNILNNSMCDELYDTSEFMYAFYIPFHIKYILPSWFKISINAGFLLLHVAPRCVARFFSEIENLLIFIWYFIHLSRIFRRYVSELLCHALNFPRDNNQKNLRAVCLSLFGTFFQHVHKSNACIFLLTIRIYRVTPCFGLTAHIFCVCQPTKAFGSIQCFCQVSDIQMVIRYA